MLALLLLEKFSRPSASRTARSFLSAWRRLAASSMAFAASILLLRASTAICFLWCSSFSWCSSDDFRNALRHALAAFRCSFSGPRTSRSYSSLNSSEVSSVTLIISEGPMSTAIPAPRRSHELTCEGQSPTARSAESGFCSLSI